MAAAPLNSRECRLPPLRKGGPGGGQTGSHAPESAIRADGIRNDRHLRPQPTIPAPQSPSSISPQPIDLDKCENHFAFQMLQTGKCAESWDACNPAPSTGRAGFPRLEPARQRSGPVAQFFLHRGEHAFPETHADRRENRYAPLECVGVSDGRQQRADGHGPAFQFSVTSPDMLRTVSPGGTGSQRGCRGRVVAHPSPEYRQNPARLYLVLSDDG